MRYQPLPPKFHTDNRAKLAKAVGPDAIAVIDTADVLYRNGDAEYAYRPDSNFYYLTGIDQPEAVLILAPGNANTALRELLFVRRTSEFIAAWEGEQHSQEEASRVSGINNVFWLDDLDHILDRLLLKNETIYLNAEESVTSVQTSPAKRRAYRLRKSAPGHLLRSALPKLAEMRIIKHPAEVAQIRRAIDITGQGLQRAWSQLKPGTREYALQAELTAGFERKGANSGFLPVVAAGANATVIHYTKNNAEVGGSDMVLFDVGAEVGWYSADISRTVPASGRFSDRQRALYDAVYRVQQAAIPLHKPGASVLSIDEYMRGLLTTELAGLGVITSEQSKAKDSEKYLRKYYAHISHHLGLETHDTGDARVEFKPGMVVTCEPGLYLKEEGIGVRIEDDILITESGCEVLSRAIPSDPDELEKLLIRG